MQLPLRLAPRHLFEKYELAQFVARFDTAETALLRLSAPPSLPDGYHRKGDLGLPQHKPAHTQFTEQSFDIGNRLVGKFKEDLIAGTLVATGIPLPAGERMIIPPNQWRRLWPNFVEESALGPLFGYAKVRLQLERNRKAVNAQLLKSCVVG